jgi:osmoprotectant transport system ATP-binding protein
MNGGHILQYDTPENIMKNPANDFVSSFVGKKRIWSSPEYIKVSDIMIERPITVSKNISALRCIDRMRQNKVDTLLVVDPDTHVFRGILRARRLRRAEDKNLPAEQFMKTKVRTLGPEQSMTDALKVVTDKYTPVPVVDDENHLVGLITKSSLVTTLSQQYIDDDEEEEDEE